MKLRGHQRDFSGVCRVDQRPRDGADILRHQPGASFALLAYLQGVVLLAKTWNDPDMVQRLAQGAVQLARTGAP